MCGEDILKPFGCGEGIFQVKEFRKIYDQINVNHDEVLDKNELYNFIKQIIKMRHTLWFTETTRTAQIIIKDHVMPFYDKDHDGIMDLAEAWDMTQKTSFINKKNNLTTKMGYDEFFKVFHSCFPSKRLENGEDVYFLHAYKDNQLLNFIFKLIEKTGKIQIELPQPM